MVRTDLFLEGNEDMEDPETHGDRDEEDKGKSGNF
jgi:hypothetical protein